MPFLTATLSHAGGRNANEDNSGYLEVGPAACWIVADGLGGHGGGATASRIAVDAVLTSFRANPKVSADALRGFLATAQAAILRQQSDPALAHMRSTVVVVLANEQTAICGHIGDSRIYHFQAGEVAFQTVDHSVPGSLAAAGTISVDQIRFHEDRNRVLRSLGNDSDVNPAIVERNLCQGDMFLLCTDGFWEYVTEFEMEADSAKATAPADWLRFMSSRLLLRAKPEHDNYTAIAIFFRSATAPLPQRKPRQVADVPTAPRPEPARKTFRLAVAVLSVLLVVLAAIAVFSRPLADVLAKKPDTKRVLEKKATSPAERPKQEQPVRR